MHHLEPPQIAHHWSGPHFHKLNPKPPGERPQRQGHTWPSQAIEQCKQKMQNLNDYNLPHHDTSRH
jgi:hypothetical protein